MSDNIEKSPFNYFTVEEINLICMYSKDDRQKAIDGLYHALVEIQEYDMVSIVCNVIAKLQNLSNLQFKELELVPEYNE